MNWLSWILPARAKNLLELVRDWELKDVGDALQLVSLMTAQVDSLDQYRASVTYGIAMLRDSESGKVPPARWSRWGGGKYLGVLRGPVARQGKAPQ